MRFRQHIPAFVSGIEPYEVEGTSLDDILKDTRIRKWAEDPAFFRWSYGRLNGTNGSDKWSGLLVAERDKGQSWMTVGFLSEEPPSLPEFIPIET